MCVQRIAENGETKSNVCCRVLSTGLTAVRMQVSKLDTCIRTASPIEGVGGRPAYPPSPRRQSDPTWTTSGSYAICVNGHRPNPPTGVHVADGRRKAGAIQISIWRRVWGGTECLTRVLSDEFNNGKLDIF